MKSNNICVIPARGGSKRIPRKNIKAFCGKPIIAYSIDAALKSGLFDEVIVSTDDEDIKNMSLVYGAKVPFLRSLKNSDDYATTTNVLTEVLGEYKKIDVEFNYACCLYPTAPFVTSNLLQAAYNKLLSEDFDCIYPVVPFSYPIKRALRIDANNFVSMIHPEFIETRSQDLEKTFHDSGQFYFFKTKLLTDSKSIINERTGAIVIDNLSAHDIDNEEDWKIAELKYNYMWHNEI